MNDRYRLKWEPKNPTSLLDVERKAKKYFSSLSGILTIFENGTLLLTDGNHDPVDYVSDAMKEVSFLTDFSVVRMNDGDYIIKFHDVVAVYLSDIIFQTIKNEIKTRINELMFPEEVLHNQNEASDEDDLLIGLFARGVLQYDAHNTAVYKVIYLDDIVPTY